MSVVYVCHAFGSNPARSVAVVRKLCRRLAADGYLPLAPQLLLPQFVDETTARDLALALCLRLLALADEVWVYGEMSKGMRREIAEARRLGVPIVQKDAL